MFEHKFIIKTNKNLVAPNFWPFHIINVNGTKTAPDPLIRKGMIKEEERDDQI